LYTVGNNLNNANKLALVQIILSKETHTRSSSADEIANVSFF